MRSDPVIRLQIADCGFQEANVSLLTIRNPQSAIRNRLKDSLRMAGGPEKSGSARSPWSFARPALRQKRAFRCDQYP
jgi:hypothetical protein